MSRKSRKNIQSDFAVCSKDKSGTVRYQNKRSKDLCGDQTKKPCARCGLPQGMEKGIHAKRDRVIGEHLCEVVILADGVETTVIAHPLELDISQFDTTALTQREKELLAHLKTGASNREIGKRMGVQPDTLKTHLAHLYKKIPAAKKLRPPQN